MNLYLVSRSEPARDDQYDALLVAANSSDQARTIHPNDTIPVGEDWWNEDDTNKRRDWPQHPRDLKVEYVGIARPTIKEPQVIIASFNAG